MGDGVTVNTEYKYDVAFSFLAEDEGLATELNDLLQDRVRTFLYSKKQGELAGTDGEEKFNLVFGEQARSVVVLYREGWGLSSWTRIEETAIRNRGHEHGYEFVTFIPLEEKPSVPKWLPRRRIWIDLKRWGAKGAAAAIEARIGDLGGQPHQETVVERATRLERSMKFQATRKNFLTSDQGVNAANKEFEGLRVELQRLIDSVKGATSSIALELKTSNQLLVIMGLHKGLSVRWRLRYSNTLDEAELKISLWDSSHPPFPGIMHFDTPKRLSTINFKIDLLPSEQVSWVSENPSRTFATNDLAAFLIKYYMDNAVQK